MGAASTFMQVEAEFGWFTNILRQEGIRSFLEIGSKFGESLKRVGAALENPSRLIAVDLPKGTRAWPHSERALKRTIDDLCKAGHDAQVIWGDSTNKGVISVVRALGPFDAIFIDANHTLPYVTADWENYGPMGRIIAFHDIAWRRSPEWGEGLRIDVPQLWQSLKGQYRHEEAKFCPSGKNNGIGVLWR